LERQHAVELKTLLLEELAKAKKQNDLEHEKELSVLIHILNSYELGEIDLMMHPNVINLT
jgi:hypothetical protein